MLKWVALLACPAVEIEAGLVLPVNCIRRASALLARRLGVSAVFHVVRLLGRNRGDAEAQRVRRMIAPHGGQSPARLGILDDTERILIR